MREKKVSSMKSQNVSSVRGAVWTEIDRDEGVWTIPATRMKAKREHRVPLSGLALAILHDVQRLSDDTSLVFRNRAREATLHRDAIEIDQGTRHRRRACGPGRRLDS